MTAKSTLTPWVRITSVKPSIKFVLVVFSTGIIAFFALTPTGHAVIYAGLLVLDLLPQPSFSPLQTFTRLPVEEEISFQYDGGETEGILYRPADNDLHGAIIFSLGYGPNPRDPLLVQIADDLARLGIVVFIPYTKGLPNGVLISEDVEILVGAFNYLQTQPFVNSKRIGFAGFCIGSSLALVAAEDSRINEQVSYINVFGGYYNARDLMRTIAARSSQYKGEEIAWMPDQQTIVLFAQNVLTRLDTDQDRQILRQVMQTPQGDTSAILTRLTPLGRLVYHLLVGSEPATVDTILAQIPEQKMAELEQLSPSAGIEHLKAKVFIMSDVSDPYIPAIESHRLADAISNPEQKVYAQFTLFDHVRPSHSSNRLDFLQEAIKLFIYLCKVMIHINV